MSNEAGAGRGLGMSDTARSNYSKEELLDMYALAKMFLEAGQIKRAEVIAQGLTSVAPEFVPGWLALSVVSATLGNIENSLEAARKALRIQPDSSAAMMLIVTTAMTLGDAGTAGTYLGEVQEMIEQGRISDANVIRLYKMQMARYSQGK
jgi:predicted Zn-dependent protease